MTVYKPISTLPPSPPPLLTSPFPPIPFPIPHTIPPLPHFHTPQPQLPPTEHSTSSQTHPWMPLHNYYTPLKWSSCTKCFFMKMSEECVKVDVLEGVGIVSRSVGVGIAKPISPSLCINFSLYLARSQTICNENYWFRILRVKDMVGLLIFAFSITFRHSCPHHCYSFAHC